MITLLALEFWTATAELTPIVTLCTPEQLGSIETGNLFEHFKHFAFSLHAMKNTFLAISSAGPNRDRSKPTREQPLWDEHAAFIDQLVAEGFILMGGPLTDENGAMLIVNADDEIEVREKLKNDPWMKHGILQLQSVKRWQIFIDVRK